MILRTPSFYSKFKCIAEKCSDTCCIGWEIDIDRETEKNYRSQFGHHEAYSQKKSFFHKLQSNIENGHFKLLPGERCPFLQKNGLCEIICKLGCNGTDKAHDGSSVLAEICREHPRFVEVYGDIMEKGIGLCCEEGARLLLDDAEPALEFAETEIDEIPDDIPEEAVIARDEIFAERNHIFTILKNAQKPLNVRLLEILDFAEGNLDSTTKKCAQKESTLPRSWVEILGQGESFGPAWDQAVERIAQKEIFSGEQSLFSENDGERIVAHLIFRYYAKSLFDGDSLGKVQFAIFFWITLKYMGYELAGIPKGSVTSNLTTAKINAIKLLSKQIEYSDEIMEMLYQNFFENPDFSTDIFRKILE